MLLYLSLHEHLCASTAATALECAEHRIYVTPMNGVISHSAGVVSQNDAVMYQHESAICSASRTNKSCTTRMRQVAHIKHILTSRVGVQGVVPRLSSLSLRNNSSKRQTRKGQTRPFQSSTAPRLRCLQLSRSHALSHFLCCFVNPREITKLHPFLGCKFFFDLLPGPCLARGKRAFGHFRAHTDCSCIHFHPLSPRFPVDHGVSQISS